MKKPLLSICLITYNHEKFIRQAIDSVLMQKVDFDWELIIADDYSKDNTREIILEYKAKYPELIKLILQEKNVGPAKNWLDLISAPKAKYVAYFEGDDFWTDPFKLQKQVDILETSPHLSGCFHNSEERFWNNYTKASSLYLSLPNGREITIGELTQFNMVPTASLVFRNPIPSELFTEKFLNLPVGDWPLHLLNTRNGNYYYLPQVMSVRNLNPQSVWSLQNHEKNVIQVVHVYNELINSGWFNEEVVSMLKTGREKLANSIKPKKISKFSKIKNKLKNKLISILNRI